jgi:hypothetical protein
MTTVREVLIAARAKIAGPDAITFAGLAVNDMNIVCDPRSEGAVAWNGEGAVFSMTGDDPYKIGYGEAMGTLAALHALDDQVGGIRVGKVAAGMTQDGILAIFDRAIAAQGAA